MMRRGRAYIPESMREPQLVNAKPGLFPLPPVSEAPAEQTRANWSALLPGQTVPLIGENDGYVEAE